MAEHNIISVLSNLSADNGGLSPGIIHLIISWSGSIRLWETSNIAAVLWVKGQVYDPLRQ